MKSFSSLKTITLFSFCLLLINCKQEQKLPSSYEVRGIISGLPNGIRVYLKTNENPKRVMITDTAVIMNEKFVFTGSTTSPLQRGLFVNSVLGSIPIILENGKIDIIVDKNNIKNSTIKGTQNNLILQKYITQKNSLFNQRKKLNIKLRSINKVENLIKYDSLINKTKKLNELISNYTFKFIKDNPNSDVSLMSLTSELGKSNIELSKFKEFLELLKNVTNRYPGNKKIAQKITKYIKQREATANLEIGKTAPTFSAPNTEEKILALNDIKGKVTIIDFWASWCGPCRRENPNVVKVYNKYHAKGLEIIGVSLDKKGQKKRWLDAIEKDKLTWHHVSNLNYFNDPVAKLYNIKSIPSTYILDSNGKIIAKNLRGEALENKIAELLN